MSVPRQLSGEELCRALTSFGYEKTRQTCSHNRLTTLNKVNTTVTVPDHKILPLGTLKDIVLDVAKQFGCSPERIMDILFL